MMRKLVVARSDARPLPNEPFRRYKIVIEMWNICIGNVWMASSFVCKVAASRN